MVTAHDPATTPKGVVPAVQRLTEAVHTSAPDVADAAAVMVNVGDLRRLLRERAAHEGLRAAVEAALREAEAVAASAPGTSTFAAPVHFVTDKVRAALAAGEG